MAHIAYIGDASYIKVLRVVSHNKEDPRKEDPRKRFLWAKNYL